MTAPLASQISPVPTDEEAVAIVAAMQVLWPRPVALPDEVQARNTAWKFSGRWWSVPLPMRRDRPYRQRN